MHKENLCINPSKPRAAIRTARNKREESAATPSSSVPLHTRLPSADSGIQADSGFDSLSRYKGETFLSTLNNQRLGADTDYVGLDPDLIGAVSSHCSSYLNDVISQESLPSSQLIVSSGSKSGVNVSKPVPPLKPTLTSSPSNPRHPRPTTPSAQTALCGNPPLPPERFDDNKTLHKGKPIPSTTGVPSSARISNTLRHPADAVDPVNLSQNVPASIPVAAQRKDTSVSVIHQQPRHLASSIDPLDSDILPKMKAADTSNDLEVSLSDSSICFSSRSLSSDQPALLSSPTGRVPTLDLDSSGNVIKTYELGCKRSPGTSHLRVLKPSNQGQSCKSLTRPLKLDAPSKLTVKTVQITTLSPHSAHLVPTFNQHPENKHQHQVSSVRPKPKIAPRPSILTKTSSSPSPILSSRISVTTFSELPSSTSSAQSAAQPSRDTCHKQEVPVVHRVKTIDPHSGRTEIPVTHVFSKSASRKYQNFTRPPSFLRRHTPDREKHAKLQSDHQPIYENIRLEARNGLDFDELDIQVKHSEMILNHSDELISDAFRLLVASPSSSVSYSGNGPVVSSRQLVEASSHRGGDGGKSQGEHVLPIFDVRTGALQSAARRSYLSDWTTRQAAFSNGNGRGTVTWSQRKEKIDSALTWLRQELANLRDMDTHLILQFHRCQDTIESLKNQRESWEGLSEEGEDGDFWEDYELNEYNRCYLDSPGGSGCNQFSPENCQPSLQDVTVMSFPVSQVCLQQVSETASEQHGVTQDIEVTL